MSVKVVDASAIAAIMFDEPEHEAAAERLRGYTIVAPPLIWAELANVCVTKARRNPQYAEAFLTAYSEREALQITITDIDNDAVARLALATRLSAYDASYLWLARSSGCELVTFDKRLTAAAAS